MAYGIPAFEVLCNSTAELLNEYETKIRRYIAPPLDVLLKNTSEAMEEYIKKQKDRTTQAKALKQLVLDLRNDLQNHANEITLANAHQVILGGLIQRYLRIQDEYKSAETALSYFGGIGKIVKKKLYDPTPTNSDVFNILKTILNITENNQLDCITVKSACEAFRTYMYKGNRYLSLDYKHYKEDPNFIKHLDIFIDTATLLSTSSLIQIKKIRFLMSFAKNIEEIHQKMQQVLLHLEKTLSEKDLPLNIGVIFRHLNDYEMHDDLRKRCALIVNRQHVAEHINKWSIVELMQELRESLQTNSNYTLLGGYMVVYQHINSDQKVLKETLDWALRIKSTNPLDAKTSLTGLRFLKQWYMKVNIHNATVDWTLFDAQDIGQAQFFAQFKLAKTQLAQTEPEDPRVSSSN